MAPMAVIFVAKPRGQNRETSPECCESVGVDEAELDQCNGNSQWALPFGTRAARLEIVPCPGSRSCEQAE